MKQMTEKELNDYYHERVIAFGRILQGPYADVVLNDLAEFCRAGKSTFHPDARVHALLEGRREVFLRIKDFLTLPAADIVKKYAKPSNQ